MSRDSRQSQSGRYLLPCAVLLLGITIVVSLLIGRYPLSLRSILAIIASTMGLHGGDGISSTDLTILFHVRMPRILLVALTGGSLAVAGAVYQGIFRNPLVSPDILGVTSGACFGAAIGLIIPGGSDVTVRTLAFVFGIIAVIAAWTIGRQGRSAPVLMLILAGIVVSAFFGAALSLVKYMADPYQELPSIVFWIMGGFHRVTWTDFMWSAPMILGGLVVMLSIRYTLNPLSLGDSEATSLGIRVVLMRNLFIIAATLVVAASVAVSGTVGWVGLVIPHLARLLVGPEHGRMIPLSLLLGSIFLLLMDDLARTMTMSEIPIGIMTSFVGAPIFAWFLIGGRKTGWSRSSG